MEFSQNRLNGEVKWFYKYYIVSGRARTRTQVFGSQPAIKGAKGQFQKPGVTRKSSNLVYKLISASKSAKVQ